MNKWIILDPYQNPGLQILKLTCQDNFQVLHWPVGLFSAELLDIETIWHYLRLSGTLWCQTEIETRYLLCIRHFFCIVICYNMNAHVMNWNKLLEIENVTKCCIFPNHNSSDLILFYGFPAVSWKYIGFFFIVLLLFHPQCAGSLVVLA